MTARATKQGQPLIVMAVVVAGWVVMRAAFWDYSFVAETPAFAVTSAADQPQIADEGGDPDVPYAAAPVVDAMTGGASEIDAGIIETPLLDMPEGEAWQAPIAADYGNVTVDTPEQRTETAASHSLLWMAAMAHVPLPDSVQHHFAATAHRQRDDLGLASPVSRGDARRDNDRHSRFSVDSWLFFRQDGEAFGQGNLAVPSYGRSQAGAVLRYRLMPHSRLQSQLYTRVTQALAGPDDRDVALGLSARPIARLPLYVHGEARLSQQSGRSEIRPAVFVTTGGEHDRLPLGVTLRGYGQAGYVGGDFATAFADGNIIAEREVAQFDLGTLAAGGGVWGGAQEGAARLDIGPTANVKVKLGEVPARIAVDYRVRVAGDAEPGSGAALTLSTGF